jgi:hypothetical protein
MYWVKADQLHNVDIINDFEDMLEVMFDKDLSEFQYVHDNGNYYIVKK